MKKENDCSKKQGKHSPYWVVSALEAEAFQRSTNRQLLAFLAGYVLLAYTLSTVLIVNIDVGLSVAEFVASAFADLGVAGVQTRFDDLTRFDGVSGISYVVSMLSGVGVGLVFTVCMVWSYNRHVLKPGRGVKVDRRAWRGFGFTVAFSVVVLWVVYLKDVNLAGNPYPGMGVIFTWPIYPLLSYLGPFTIALLGYTVIAGSWKTYLQRKRNLNGG